VKGRERLVCGVEGGGGRGGECGGGGGGGEGGGGGGGGGGKGVGGGKGWMRKCVQETTGGRGSLSRLNSIY